MQKEQNQLQAKQTQDFVVGRIYQMKDGSLAKYVGDNKFLKVKMK